MRLASLRVLGAVTGLLVVAGAVHVLREATMSTHYDTGPDSRVTVVVRAEQNRAEAGVTLAAAATAQMDLCGLEVGRSGEVRPVPGTDDRFRVILTPALDSTDRKQYGGCLEDWAVDHLRLHVVSVVDAGPVRAGP